MKVIIANAPWEKPGFYGVRAGSRWPHFEKESSNYMPFPFFMAYSAALLEKNGHHVTLIDAIALNLDEEVFFQQLQDCNPELVVFEVSTPSIDVDLRIARRTKDAVGETLPVVFCGPHHEMFSDDFLKRYNDVDIVMRGEYEFTLLDLVNTVSGGGSLENVMGIIYRDESGNILTTHPRPLERNLEKFPWPARKSLPMEKYLDLPGGIPAPSLQVWASRGCPFSCIFCSWPQLMYGDKSYRTRDPKDVVDEIECCVEQYGFKSFYFDDDTFNVGKERMLSLCNEIKKRDLSLPWAIMARADGMDLEILSAMKDAGLVALKYGVESGDQEILKATGKSLNLDKVHENVKITRELGIKYHLTFTFGLPGETLETIKKTVDLALELDPDSLQFSIVTPFPGSKYFDLLDKKGHLLSKNWEEYDGYNRAVIRTDNLTNTDLEHALCMANKKWKRHVFRRMFKRGDYGAILGVLRNPIRAYLSYKN